MKKKLLTAVIAVSLVLSSAPFQKETSHAASSGEIIKSVNFRDQPSLSSNQIRFLRQGENVEIIEKVNSYWYKIKDQNGKIGYVSTRDEYIKVLSQSNISSTNATVIWGVNFRTGPSTSHSRIRMLPKGEKVTILSQPHSNWYEVQDKNGRVGFVSSNSKYLKTSFSGGSNSSGSNIENQKPTVNAQSIINAGKAYMGTPYEFGSKRSSTSTFDCSDFVRRAFIDGAGITLPTDSRKQGAYVKQNSSTTTNWRNLNPGDLMFFMSYKGTSLRQYSGINKSQERITHVAIYLGNGQILHTYSQASGGVRINNIANNHWEYRFIFGGSAL